MPKHKHADLIIAWANGAEIEYFYPRDNEWAVTKTPDWSNGEFRIKHERAWPVTSLNQDELWDLYAKDGDCNLERVANAAIKRYIEDNEK